jgi:hypothetical protein
MLFSSQIAKHLRLPAAGSALCALTFALAASLVPLAARGEGAAPAPDGARPDEPILCLHPQQREEADCLARLKGRATRRGAVLRLALDNGKTKVFTSNKKACQDADSQKCVEFELAGYYPLQRLFMVQEGYYECGVFDLVSARSGAMVQVAEVPEFSPGGRRFVSIDANDACHGKYDIAIWSTQTDPPTAEYKYSPTVYEAWEFKGWIDDEHIDLKVGFHGDPPSERKWMEQPAQAVRTDNKWRLVRGKAIEATP